MGSLDEVVRTNFPGSLPEQGYLDAVSARLGSLGFTGANTIASVCGCRDEICQSLLAAIEVRWGEAFDLASLAGLFTAGRTALGAAVHHAPQQDGRERYVYFVFSHLAIDEEGHLGRCSRKGIRCSQACGALHHVLADLAQGELSDELDELDLELSLLRRRLRRELPAGASPDLLALTRLVRQVATDDLRQALQGVIASRPCDWALLSGIQLHLPQGSWIWPAAAEVQVAGQAVPLAL
ncbi:MAG: hypothetical protein RBU45_09765 [Myxococcota bacterium]|jgi:hypothetical protein|nr:hypothetical protein [Myxococcota bacterium]